MFPASALLTAALAAGPDAVDEAAGLVEDERFEEATRVLREHHQRRPGDARSHALYGEALYELDRDDEAAHHLGLALERLERNGDPDSREARRLRSRLKRADPLLTRREAWFKKLTRTAVDAAEDLAEAGHHERALDLLERVAPFAPRSAERDREELLELLAEERARFAEVDLDAAGGGEEVTEAHPLVEVESERYVVAANLEPDVADLVARTMDDVFDAYVEVYFDGDERRVSGRKATIRVHPDHEAMMAEWSDPSRSVGGWWSPGEWRVVCYDTRTDSGSLDAMLRTLFHEASHQFMTMLSRGGSAPSWLNEGTATFFEGATAMSDGRVLWPEAAPGRLASLAAMLRSGSGPDVRDVVAYDEPASYPGDHYPFGWGLVYFLQQWEDPETLEYAWRPRYLRYLEHVTTRGGDPLELFGELVLGGDDPGGFDDFEAFAAAWERWILEEVRPLHLGPEVEERRWARLERYLAAAEAAEEHDDAPVPARELRLRALGSAQKLREAEDPEAPDLALRRIEIDLYERLERPETAAARIEELLELAAADRVDLAPEERDALDERMAELDRSNYPLRSLRTKLSGLRRSAERLLDRYARRREPMLLRSWSFARAAATALDDDGALYASAERLRAEARDAGLVPSRVLAVAGERWAPVFSAPAVRAERAEERIDVEMPALQAAALCLDVEVSGEYELRARLAREGELYGSSYHGVVVSGTPDGDCLALLLDRDGRLVVRRVERSPGGGTTSRTIAIENLYPAVAPDESPELAVRVRPDATLRVTVGARDPVDLELDAALPDTAHVGYYVIDGRLVLTGFVVEIFP